MSQNHEMTVEGSVERSTMGLGAWALVTPEGQTYEIYQQNAPEGLLKANQRVKATGQVRQDVMTIAMIGPIFEVFDFELV
ncbi:MAG: hypothetical protein AAF215_02405 [Cyanobacteria bacterium P01_A01_bin.123]